MKFRKKPVVIEAVQIVGTKENLAEILRFSNSIGILPDAAGGYSLTIKTLEGVMQADVGDWIIKGVKGEFYPCKPDIFEQTYEKVEMGEKCKQ